MVDAQDQDGDSRFEVTLNDGRIARCWRACIQPYDGCGFEAGLVEGLGVDTVYFMVRRDEQDEPYMLFLRPDEAQAMIWAISGALWSQEMMALEERRSNGANDRQT